MRDEDLEIDGEQKWHMPSFQWFPQTWEWEIEQQFLCLAFLRLSGISSGSEPQFRGKFLKDQNYTWETD